MADLSSILGGMVQGFKDFGTGLVDFFGTGAANIGDIATSITTGRATTKNQDDFRKWLYQTDDKQDAAAKGLGTILNGVSTVADVMPGAQAVTANPLFNGLQGAIGGVSDELKMAGKDADWGRAAQRAGVGAASGLASGYAGQGLAKTGNKLLSNGLTRGAVSGALGGGIANAGYTGIEGGSVQDMINAGLYGAQTGALVGGTTGLARELIKPAHKMDVALTDDEKAARIANIDDQLGKLDLSTPEGNARYNELAQQRQQYSGNKRLYRGLGQEYDPNYPKNKLDTQGYESWTDNPELARQYGENVYYIDVPEGDIKTSYLDENPMSETYGDRNPIYSIDKKAGLNGVSGNEYLLSVDDPYKEGLTYNRLGGKTKTVADLMNEPKTYYHGSPATDITEFDINRAGKNTRSGEKAIYFTDTPEAAEEFAYERIPTDSIFVDKAGKRGGVYEANLDMRNTLDLDNLTDAQIRELWNYASPLGQLDGQEAFVQRLTDWRDKYHNPQLTKGYIDLEALRNSPYDSFSATMYPNTDNKAREYAIFDASKAKITKSPKTVADLMLSPDDDVMASKINPDQLDLFSQPKQKPTAKKATNADEQLDLFSQPRPVEPENPYAPVDGKVTDKMRARADMLTKTTDIPARNDLYSKIDPETMPKTGIDVIAAEAEGIKGQKAKRDYITKKYLGVDNADDMTLDQAADAYYDMFPTDKQEFIGQVKRIVNSSFYGDNVKEQILENSRKALIKRLKTRVNKAADATTKRGGYAGAADTALSERLGIAPGNTNKRTAAYDDKGSAGRYRTGARELAVKEQFDPENAVSTVAHERLHSFQAESKPEILGRYSDEVKQAYNELSSELKQFRHTQREIAKRYGYKTKYWSTPDEQEARMFQQYLQNKGYADAPQLKNGSRANEWGDEINPAFDKFIDKLRDLSKRGIALPAITALFGGGAFMAATQGDDKKKKSEVK